MRSPWLTSSDRQARDEWEDVDTATDKLTSSCQGRILQSSTHMLLPFWTPTEHPTSSCNFFPECHCALSLYGSIRMLFLSISVITSLPSSCLHVSLTALTPFGVILPLGFPSLLLHSLPLASHPHISAYGQMLLSKQLSELANDSSSPTNVLTVQLTHVH